MWPDKPIAFVRLENDEKGRHFALLKGADIISIVSLFVNNNHAQFRKFATKTSEQGNGYGTLLLNHLMNIARNEIIENIWCNARVEKSSYYEKFGMKQTTKRFIKEGVEYIIMEKQL